MTKKAQQQIRHFGRPRGEKLDPSFYQDPRQSAGEKAIKAGKNVFIMPIPRGK